MSRRLVSPLVISANAPVDEVRSLVRHAFEVNAAAQERRQESGPPPMEWVLVRRTVGFDVKWYLLRVWDLNGAFPDDAPRGATLLSEMGLEEHQSVPAMQLADMTDTTSGPAVVLVGTRVFALIAPQLMSSAEGTTRSVTTDETVRLRGRPEPTGEHPAPSPGRTRGLRPAIRIDAAAYVNAPRRVVPSKNFTVELGLAATPMPEVIGGNVAINFQEGELAVVLDIRVEGEGFEAKGGSEVSLLVPRHDPYSTRVVMVLRALPLPDGAADELRALQILYSCKGSACGSATYRILVQREETEMEAPTPPTSAPRVAIDTSTPPIDLTLRMAWKDDSEATHTLQWSFTSPHELTPPTGKMTRSSPELAALPISIVDELAQSDAQEGIELLMGGIAKRIADEIPAGVWEVLANVTTAVRSQRGADAIPTVLLSTQETRVPWELALMPTPPDSTREPSLNTQYIVTRWILDDNVRPVPPASVSGRDLVAVFGDYAGARGVNQLPFARKEADYIIHRNGVALDATRSAIVQLLTGKLTTTTGTPLTPGILHFAGHGEAARSGTAASFIVLNDGSSLSTTFFLNSPALKKSHPLVFLNACQLGAATSTLGQPGGFAGVCVRGECSVVIAPLWSVNDEVAYDVATKFYDDILAGTPVAEAMFKSRAKPFTDITYKDQNGATQTRTTATRLAYLVYGHPSFRF